MATPHFTRYGRKVRQPHNEYTERKYVPGSGVVGCDHYDHGFCGGSDNSFSNALELSVEKAIYENISETNEMDDFIVEDGQFEEVELHDESEEEDDDELTEDESDYYSEEEDDEE